MRHTQRKTFLLCSHDKDSDTSVCYWFERSDKDITLLVIREVVDTDPEKDLRLSSDFVLLEKAEKLSQTLEKQGFYPCCRIWPDKGRNKGKLGCSNIHDYEYQNEINLKHI
jgi:hypothetical protein